MKQILHSLPFLFLASAAAAHESAHAHPHLTDPDWAAMAVGLLMIGVTAFIAWSRK